MLKALREFQIGRPQLFAGALLLVFAVQCLWVASGRRYSDLEYEYMSSGHRALPGQEFRTTSPVTAVVAAFPLKAAAAIRPVLPSRMKAALAIPPAWWVRLPFVLFGVWLGGALWWVARRLFGNSGGYVALGLYCASPAMVKASTNIGPEIILAWSSFGLIYTAIGVAHTLYAPPKKWAPRIVLLGIALGLCAATEFWALVLVIPALAFMLYLAPGRRDRAFLVMGGALGIGGVVMLAFKLLTGSFGLGSTALITPKVTMALVNGLYFVLTDDRAGFFFLALIFVAALVVYCLWNRARYFGNTAPLAAGFLMVLIFALVPGIYLWVPPLGMAFCFVFIAGVAADVLEASGSGVAWGLAAFLALKFAFGLVFLGDWMHQIV
jgi:hypothetical protein